MKNNNKLARNTIRARKAQKKRAIEQDKPIKGKRWFSRLFALIGCLLLVSALALPCFADYNPTPNPGEGAPGVSDDNDGSPSPSYTDAALVKSFLAYMSVTDYEPLYKLMTYGAYIPSENSWVFQFTVNIPLLQSMQYISYNVLPLNIDGDVYCYYGPTRQYYIIRDGWWTVSNATIDGNTFVYFDFYTMLDGMDMLQLRISINMNNSAGSVENVEYILPQYGTFDGQNMICATAVSKDNITPLVYGLNAGLLVPFHVSLTNFEDYKAGYMVSYAQGYAEGKYEWYQRGLDEGWYMGNLRGYMDGYDKGYEDGEADGFADGKAEGENSNEAYQRGYDAAVSQINSGQFGANFLGATFSAPIKALRDFVIVDLPDGRSITLMGIFSAALALILLIAFMRKFAGN